MKKQPIYFIDRETREQKEELIYCERQLRFFYESKLGGLCAKFISTNPFFSKFLGWWQRRSWTKRNILPFITKYGVDAQEIERPISEYRNFDEFFSRKLRSDARTLAPGAILPADGRYLFYQNVDECDGFVVKGKKFSFHKLLGDPKLAEKYASGSMILVRLCPTDYHRFHFPVDCIPGPAHLINGPLYSVSPFAVKQSLEIFTENKRMYTELHTEKYGTILFIEVGATCVGAIHQTYTPNQPYKKGDEKGYFSFGGSSLILLFEKEKIKFARDLLAFSEHHVEIFCRFGQPMEDVESP